MQDVTREVDTRVFPMEIAKNMLHLGNALNMGRGPTAYNEAENELTVLLQVLTMYHKVVWPERLKYFGQFNDQKQSIIRYIKLKQFSPELRATVAKKLLDHIKYFPELKVNEPKYLETLSGDEYLDECDQSP
jgi:hypothetical protein